MPYKGFDWTPECIALLGTVPDEQLGKQLGLSGVAVLKARRRFGKAPYQSPAWPADHVALLGTMSDQQVATRIGVTRQVVRAERLRRGIAAYDAWLQPTPRASNPDSARRRFAADLQPAQVWREEDRAWVVCASSDALYHIWLDPVTLRPRDAMVYKNPRPGISDFTTRKYSQHTGIGRVVARHLLAAIPSRPCAKT